MEDKRYAEEFNSKKNSNNSNGSSFSIQNQMLQDYNDINQYGKKINSNILDSLENQELSTDELNSEYAISNEILKDISSDMIYLAQKSYVTDIFLILDTKEENTNKLNISKREGIYIKDSSPTAVLKNNSDLDMKIGTINLANYLQIDNDNGGRYSIIAGDNPKIITYSIPLIENEGNPYGVLGMGIDLEHINKNFIEDRANRGNLYAIVVERQEVNGDHFKIEDIMSIGEMNEELTCIHGDEIIKKEEGFSDIYTITSKDNKKKTTYIFKKELNLYIDNEQGLNEKWYVIIRVGTYKLFHQINKLKSFLRIFIIISTLVAGGVAFKWVKKVTSPIRALAEKVRGSNPRESLQLDKIDILEIDELSSAITTLSSNIAYESSKLNKIINSLNAPLDAFKHKKNDRSVYCTSRFFHILGVEGIHDKAEYIDLESFKKIIENATKNKYENEEDVYTIKQENKEDRWIRLSVQEEETGTFGIVIDVTQDVLEKMKIEYDRDHDVLTNLLNRRAFQRKFEKQISKDKTKIAALIMWDLDNLKFVNDTYGHEYGDKYIGQAASILKEFEKDNALVGRISGDEFLVFMYGYNSKAEIMDRVKEVHSTMKNTVYDFPYYHYNKIKIRASAGIAWYPDDADNYNSLVKYADFAMYKIKNTVKGSIAEFNRDEYDKNHF